MFTKVLVATDLSKASERMICGLSGLKMLGTTEILLIHCINIRDVGSIALEVRELAEPALEKHKKLLEDQDFKVTAKIVLGLPHISISREADEHECSLIVVGSHGRTMAAEVLLGGVADALVKSVTKPILVIHMRLNNEGEKTISEEIICDPGKHVLFPTDFSDFAQKAFFYVQQIVQSGCRRVTLLHVQNKSSILGDFKDKLEELNRIDRERLEHMESRLKDFGATEVNIELIYGLPKQEIVQNIEQNNYSLVVMGTHGRGFFGKLLIGSVSHHVVQNTAVSTLLVPPVK